MMLLAKSRRDLAGSSRSDAANALACCGQRPPRWLLDFASSIKKCWPPGVIAFVAAYRLRHKTVGSSWHLLRQTGRAPERLPTLVQIPTRNGRRVRGAAGKSGGWRSSGTLSCWPKPMVDEQVYAKAVSQVSPQPTTCKLRSRTPTAAFCAAHETHLAGVPD
jgi:hypothetical protein